MIIKINNKNVWFNKTDSISISFTNIPIDFLKFNDGQEILWKVERKKFDFGYNTLHIEVVDYYCTDYNTFIKQKNDELIRNLIFEVLDWVKLEPLLSSFQKEKIAFLLKNTSSVNETKTLEFNSGIDYQVTNQKIKQEPIITNFSEEFTININDCRFMLGYVKFSKHIKRLNHTIDFKIINDNILAEFDNIKYWFSKKLKTKKFKIRATFILTNNKLTTYEAVSNDVDKIDQQLIEGIKVMRTLAITKSIRPKDLNKALFTSDDLYSLDNTNDLDGNVFKQTEKDILDTLIEKGNVRNKRELTYLSGSKQSLNYRMRFTNHPKFGFIFTIEGELNNHFIWELLNSHATYIWTIGKEKKEIELQYKRIESTINTILECGRENYKRAYQTANQDNDLIFNVINHKNKNSGLIDEFPIWKHRINELIT